MQLLIQSLTSGTLIGGVYALAGIGLSLVFGVMNVSNFAHGDLMMLGMYATYFLFTLFGIDPFVSVLITVPLMFFFGAALQRIFINRALTAPHQNQILLTVGLGLFLSSSALLAFTGDYRLVTTSYSSASFDIAGISVSLPLLLSFLVTVLITGLLYLFLMKTETGASLRATAQDRTAAQLMGINVTTTSMIAFGLGTALAAAAGALIAPTYYIYPLAGHNFLLKSFTICVLGGLGSIFGATAGGIIIGITEALASTYIATDWKDVAVFVVFILVLLLKPNGLFSKGRS